MATVVERRAASWVKERLVELGFRDVAVKLAEMTAPHRDQPTVRPDLPRLDNWPEPPKRPVGRPRKVV